MADKSLCKIDGCSKPIKARGWCAAHWARWRKTGTPDASRPVKQLRKGCSVEGCGSKHASSGYCWAHLYRFKKYGDPLGKKESRKPTACSIDGCCSVSIARGFCSSHWQKWRKYGDPLGFDERRAYWTEERTSRLVELYPSVTNKELAARHFPEVSERQIYTKAQMLGLRKSNSARRRAMEHVYAQMRGREPWNKGDREQRACAECGCDFDVLETSPAKYCSHRCASDAKKRVRGEDHPLYSLVSRSCAWCGAEFQAKPAKVKYGEGKYCSRQCVGTASAAAQDGRRSSIEIEVEAVLQRLGEPFVAQKKMGRFLCDFYLPSRKLVIECDGDYWHSRPKQRAKDAKKDRWLTSHGQKVVRLRECEIKADSLAAVLGALTDGRTEKLLRASK